MMNLKQPVAKILINNWTTTTGAYRVGLFEDYTIGRKVLSFKEEGINIIGQVATGTYASPAVPLIGALGLFTGFSGFKACSDPGENEFQFIELNPSCPCDPCDWPYYLTLEKHVKEPGVNNNESNYFRKSYSGVVPVVTCSGTPSVIDDAILESVEDDLITQISEDTGMHSNNSDIETGTMAVAEARRAYVFTELTAGSAGIIITINGVATTIATGASDVITCNSINSNATVRPYVMAFSVKIDDATDYKFCVMSRTNGQLFTIALAAGSTATIDGRYIALVAKDPKVQFAVQYDNAFATTTRRNLLMIAGNAAIAVNHTLSFRYLPTSTGYTTGNIAENTDATFAGNINTAILALATPPDDQVAASYDAYNGYVYVYGSNNIEGLTLNIGATSAITIPYAWSGTGQWPTLTGSDVFQIFWNQKDGGTLSAMQYLDQVNPDDDYCLYVMKTVSDIYAIHGASHLDHYQGEVHLYVKSSIIATLIHDANIATTVGLPLGTNYNIQPDTNAAVAAAFTADTALETLLGIWSGAAVASWV